MTRSRKPCIRSDTTVAASYDPDIKGAKLLENTEFPSRKVSLFENVTFRGVGLKELFGEEFSKLACISLLAKLRPKILPDLDTNDKKSLLRTHPVLSISIKRTKFLDSSGIEKTDPLSNVDTSSLS